MKLSLSNIRTEAQQRFSTVLRLRYPARHASLKENLGQKYFFDKEEFRKQ